MRIGPNQFSISDMGVAREVYGPRTSFEKVSLCPFPVLRIYANLTGTQSDFYISFTNPGGKTLVSMRNNKMHRDLRRKFQHSFSMSQVVKMEYLIDQSLEILFKKLKQLAEYREKSDLLHWLKLWSMDNSSLLIFGESFGCVEQDADVNGLLQLTRASTFYASVVGIIPEWHKVLWNYVPSWIMSEKEVRSFAEKQIEEKEVAKDSTRGACFLDTWFQQKEADRMDKTEVRIGIGGALGGTELTPSFMCQAMYHVYREPAVLQRLRDEIDTRVVKSDTGSHSILPHEAIQGMPYLQAVLKEIMRLWPVAGVTFSRVVPEGGAYLAGYHFRAGQVIGINYWAASRNTQYFGEDAAEFRPERWLDDPEDAKRANYYSIPVRLAHQLLLTEY